MSQLELQKLCECGCGEPAPIATQTRSKWGHVAGQPLRFIQGHQNKRHRGDNNPMRRPEVLARFRGSKNAGWKGDAIAYSSAHQWLDKNYEKDACEECGATDNLEWAWQGELGKHSRHREDYRVLCMPCHRYADWGRRVKERCSNPS